MAAQTTRTLTSATQQPTVNQGQLQVLDVVEARLSKSGNTETLGAFDGSLGRSAWISMWNSMASAGASIAQAVADLDARSSWATKEMTVHTVFLLATWLQAQGMMESAWDGKANVPEAARATCKLRQLHPRDRPVITGSLRHTPQQLAASPASAHSAGESQADKGLQSAPP